MNPTPSSSPTEESAPSPWVWPILLVAVVAAILLRLVTPQLQLFNFSMVGALALFAGGRLRTPLACMVPMFVMVVSDLLLWQMYGYKPFNLISYFAFALYIALGYVCIERGHIRGIIGSTLAGGLLFFLLTNGAVWWGNSVNPALLPDGRAYLLTMQGSAFPYPRIEYARNLDGLIACYWLALPFFRNTLASDVLFVTGLFGAEAILACYAPGGLFAREAAVMKFAAIIEYLQDKEKVDQIRPTHRQYLNTLLANGQLAVSGPLTDGSGAIIVYEADSAEEAETILKGDPFFLNGIFLSWRIRPWNPVFIRHDLFPTT